MAAKPVRIVATIWTVILMISTWILSFSLQAVLFPFAFLFLSRVKRVHLLGHVFRKISMLVTILNPFWRVNRVGERMSHSGKAIVMANHLSNSDPFIMTRALFPNEAKFIAKSVLFKIPFGGWAMALSGDIAVHFTSDKGGWGTKKGSVGKMMNDCKTLPSEGAKIMAFPEGARSPSGELQGFKDGFFMLAVETNTPIIPVAIAGTEIAQPFEGGLLDSASISYTVGSAVTPLEGETPQQLRERVRGIMEQLLTKLPPIRVNPNAKAWAQPDAPAVADKNKSN